MPLTGDWKGGPDACPSCNAHQDHNDPSDYEMILDDPWERQVYYHNIKNEYSGASSLTMHFSFGGWLSIFEFNFQQNSRS